MISLRPSASHIWTKCQAMPRFAADLPEEPATDPAREGTCAAWLAECVLKGEFETCADMIGHAHENGWLVEADMARHIQKYVDKLRSYGGTIGVERKVRLNTMIEGTPDAFAVLTDEGVLIVDDLKYGHDLVNEYKNPQISIYAGAIIRNLMTRDVVIKKVVIGVYQPRAHSPRGIHRTWTVWPEQLMEFVHEIEEHGHRCQDTMSIATPGEHCRHCPAAGVCAAVAATNYAGFKVITDTNRTRMTPEELSNELDFLNLMEPMLAARKSAVQAEAKARMMRGEYVPRYSFEHGFGNRRFTVAPGMVKMITGIDPYVEPKACSPAELERRGADPKVIETITEKPRIAPKLTRTRPDFFKDMFPKKTT